MYSSYKVTKINSISEVNVNINNHNQFILKKNAFIYSSKKNNNQLIVFFHGAIWKGVKVPIFRGYQYHSSVPNTDILSLSDVLLKDYENKELKLSWFLSTEKEDLFKTYVSIISKILEKNYKKVLFTGASGGGYPAIKFSSYFNKSCLIQNSQIYLEEYFYFNELKKIVNDVKYTDINKFIKENGPPKDILICQNQLDTEHYEKHALPFEEFIKKNYSNVKCKTNYFKIEAPKGSGKHAHHYNLPVYLQYHDLLYVALQNI
tara:strand:+ start:1507 stop:2289 length:783 start_codon:yes stop_codon:yes gene_type:complete